MAKGRLPGPDRRQVYRNLAHAFRTPLVALQGYTDFLFQYTEGLTRNQQTQLVEVRNAGLRMTRLVDAFLDVASFDLDLVRMNLRPEDLRVVVRRVAGELRGWLGGQRIGLRVELPKSPVSVLADPDWMPVLVRSLLVNAAHSSPKGARLRLSLRARARRAELSVTDQGPALNGPSERLFRPFLEFRRPKDGSRPEGGGLGLVLAERIAAAHGGAILAAPVRDGLRVEVRLKRSGRTVR